MLQKALTVTLASTGSSGYQIAYCRGQRLVAVYNFLQPETGLGAAVFYILQTRLNGVSLLFLLAVSTFCHCAIWLTGSKTV